MTTADKLEIIEAINLYAIALDSHRYDLFSRVFTSDIRCDFGGGAAFADLDTLVSAFAGIHAVFSAHQHRTSGHVVTIAADEAQCLSYVHASFLRDVEGGNLFESAGWYDDKLVRTSEGWRIAERISRMVTAAGNPRVMQAMPDVDTDFQLVSLSEEAEAGAVGFFAALARTST